MDGSRDKKAKAEAQSQLVLKNNFVAVFRIEKNGRGGKTVTVLDKLPAHETFVEQLTKEFKTKCGVGGSFSINGEYGTIEIQGDKRDAMKKILESKQIKFKGV